MGGTLGHVFIIGGTGMLAEASRWISERAISLTLAARNPEPLAKMLGAIPLQLDWSNRTTALPDMAFDIAITWLHDDGIWLTRPAENLLQVGGRSIRIHGSNSFDPAMRALRDPDPRKDVKRQTVILGWIDAEENKRWLTNGEICDGVITAINAPDREIVIVGNADGQ